MKRIFLACALAALTTAPALAQDAKSTPAATTQKVDAHQLFSSRITELKAHLSRNKPETAMNVYMEIAKLMHEQIAANNEKLAHASSGAEKDKLKKLIDQQETLYRESKLLTSDLVKNQEQLVSKMESFSKTF